MALDMFLRIGGIKGESVDATHAGEIDVLHFDWSMRQNASAHRGPGGGSGKVSVGDLLITKPVDRSSPVLKQMCVRGSHIKEAVLTVRKAGAKPLEYFRVTMKDILVSSLRDGCGRSVERLTEFVSLNFASVKVEYVPQRPDGSGDASICMSWNIAKNAES